MPYSIPTDRRNTVVQLSAPTAAFCSSWSKYYIRTRLSNSGLHEVRAVVFCCMKTPLIKVGSLVKLLHAQHPMSAITWDVVALGIRMAKLVNINDVSQKHTAPICMLEVVTY